MKKLVKGNVHIRLENIDWDFDDLNEWDWDEMDEMYPDNLELQVSLDPDKYYITDNGMGGLVLSEELEDLLQEYPSEVCDLCHKGFDINILNLDLLRYKNL